MLLDLTHLMKDYSTPEVSDKTYIYGKNDDQSR